MEHSIAKQTTYTTEAIRTPKSA